MSKLMCFKCDFNVLIPSVLVITFFSAINMLAAGFGNHATHTNMPALPTDPTQYESMWDPFVIRDTNRGTPLNVISERLRNPNDVIRTIITNDMQLEVREEFKGELRVLTGFDALPWNGRQITRNKHGIWLVLAEDEGHGIVLGMASGDKQNPYRPRGGDFTTFNLVGTNVLALLQQADAPERASMVVDNKGKLHVIWHSKTGLWHTMSDASSSDLGHLRSKSAWSDPKALVDKQCCPGDIMVDSNGAVVVGYAMDDGVYYKTIDAESAERVAAVNAGLPALGRTASRIRSSERECQDVVMDLADDGSVFLAFRRDFAIWVAKRTLEGGWQPAECVAREYCYHPSIMVVNNKPLIVFLHEGLRRIPLDIGNRPGQRAGGGANIGYATFTDGGWHMKALAKPEEIPVFRRGMWAYRSRGRIFPQIEQFGWPVLFKDNYGVTWVLWQNTTRRWAYSARWMGEGFGDVYECRGPFNAPHLPVNVEKHALQGAADVGMVFYAAAGGSYNAMIFDRLRIPTLDTTEDREILFLDNLEVSSLSGVDFALNQMHKPTQKPAASPDAENMLAWTPSVRKRGDIYVMSYSSLTSLNNLDEPQGSGRRYAISRDGINFEKVDKLPEGLPPPEDQPTRFLGYWQGEASVKPPAYYLNHSSEKPDEKYVRLGFSKEARGSYWVEFSSDGKQWHGKRATTATECMRERATPGMYIEKDPERPIRMYSRVYTETGRSWGVIWSRDLIHWSGMEHLLHPDIPYDSEPAQNRISTTEKHYNMRGQVFLDGVAGKGEDEIYAASVRWTEGIFFCFYWPGRMGCPLTDVGLAVSRDGFNFTRVKNGERVLPVGEPGAWDSGYIFQMYPMVDGETVRVFYRGTAGRREGSDGFRHNLTEIGVANIRVNGWTYYTPAAGSSSATVTTIPIESKGNVAGQVLTVNIEGSKNQPGGGFGVEVLDAVTDQVLDGFSRAECKLGASEGIDVPVTWSGGNFPPDKSFKLRFCLDSDNMRFYSFNLRGSSVTTQ